MQGQPGFLTLRYKNNTLNVYVKEQYELMKLAKCDTLLVPLKCDPRACESIVILKLCFYFVFITIYK